MKKLFSALLVILIGGSYGASINSKKEPPLLAVIEIVNNTNEQKAFVSGMPDMLITELLQGNGIRLVERTKIKTAMNALKIEISGITDETNIELGKWLGADGIIVGTFNKFQGKYRLDIRVINVKTGTITIAVGATREKNTLLDLIPEVGTLLRNRLVPKEDQLPVITAPLEKKEKIQPLSRLSIKYKMIIGVFAQVSVPFQRIRIYLNDKLVHTSSIVDELNYYFTILDKELPAGRYVLKLEHGTIHPDGSWKRSLNEQPKKFSLSLKHNKKTTLKYKMRAEDRWNTFSDINFN